MTIISKIHIVLTSALLLGLVACSDESQPTRKPHKIALVLSPALDPISRKKAQEAFLDWIENAVPGDQISVIDGYHLQTISEISIPLGALGENKASRFEEVAKDLAAVTEFLESDGEKIDGRLRLPEALRRIGTTRDVEMIVAIGSPLYPDEPYSFADGYCPNDAHLSQLEKMTPFGTQGNEGLLAGVKVHIGSPFGPEHYDHNGHAYSVHRFWALYVERLCESNSLVTFGDISDAFRRGIDRNSESKRTYKLDEKEKEMRMVKIVLTPDWLENEVEPTQLSSAPLPTTATKHQELKLNQPGALAVGIRWEKPNSGPIDLDLFLGLKGQPEVYYANRENDSLHFIKDYRAGDESWELITFKDDITLQRFLDNLDSCWVNFYSGSCPGGASGEIRVRFQDQVYLRQFKIPAVSGNQGDDRDGDRLNEYWVKVNLLEIMGLDEIPKKD